MLIPRMPPFTEPIPVSLNISFQSSDVKSLNSLPLFLFLIIAAIKADAPSIAADTVATFAACSKVGLLCSYAFSLILLSVSFIDAFSLSMV